MSNKVRRAIGITEEIYKTRDRMVSVLGEERFIHMYNEQRIPVLIKLMKCIVEDLEDDPESDVDDDVDGELQYNPMKALLLLLNKESNDLNKQIYISVVCEMLEPTLTRNTPTLTNL